MFVSSVIEMHPVSTETLCHAKQRTYGLPKSIMPPLSIVGAEEHIGQKFSTH